MSKFRCALLAAAIAPTAILASAAGAQDMPNPGKWQVEGKTTNVDMAMPAGVPAQMADMIKNRIMNTPAQNHSQCLTRDDLENAPENLVKSSESNCKYETFEMGGGKLNAMANCSFPQGGSGTMEMTGNFTATTFSTKSIISMQAGPMGAMTITAESTGKRVGDC